MKRQWGAAGEKQRLGLRSEWKASLPWRIGGTAVLRVFWRRGKMDMGYGVDLCRTPMVYGSGQGEEVVCTL